MPIDSWKILNTSKEHQKYKSEMQKARKTYDSSKESKEKRNSTYMTAVNSAWDTYKTARSTKVK